MSISTLDVVNGCLATMGESPLNALDADHPYVQAALQVLNSSNNLELSRGWWFNTDEIDLVPDMLTGFVPAPADALNIDTAYTRIVQRGTRMFDRMTSTYDLRAFMSEAGLSVIRAVIVRDIPFEDLPLTAQYVVSHRAKMSFQAAYDADQQRFAIIGQLYQQAFNTLKADDIRNSNVNMFNSPGVAAKLSRINPMGARTSGGLQRRSRG